jgi:hypothetical protein
MEITLDRLPLEDSERAFLRRTDLRFADMMDLTLKFCWSTVAITHDDYVFDGYGFAIDCVANLVYACESLAAKSRVTITLMDSGDWLEFEKVPSGVRMSDNDSHSVTISQETLVNAVKSFSTKTIADLTREFPALGDNPGVTSLAKRARRLRTP